MEEKLNKVEALAQFLGIDAIEINESYQYGDIRARVFEAEGGEYLVLTDEQADRLAAEEIESELWAFNADFIIEKTGLANKMSSYEAKNVIESLKELQWKCCESCNEFIKAVIVGTCGLENFILAAINADGRSHFIAHYDDEENTSEDGNFYIYRIN